MIKYPPLEYQIVTENPDAPIVVLLHGFAATPQQVWVGTGWVKRIIEEGFSCVLIRLPYHGQNFEKTQDDGQSNFLKQSELDIREGQIELSGEDFFSALTQALHLLVAQLETTVHVVGFSAGSRIGQAFAGTYPADVKSLTLAGLSPQDHYAPLEKFLENADSDRENPPEDLNPMFLTLIDHSPIKKEGLAGFVKAMENSDSNAQKVAPAHSTLVVVGTLDHIAGDSSWLIERLEEARVPHRLQILQKRDHINSLTSGVFKKATLAWMRSVENSGSINTQS